jgi:Uma2 family endonuclease
MSTVQNIATLSPETPMVLENVAWDTYVALSEQRRGSVPRMTYDEGVLELMSPSYSHENIGSLAGRMIETYSELRGIEIISVASMTVKRSDLSKGFEADESYYVTYAAELLGKHELDFLVDPAPDLVVEVELTSSMIQKMKLFAAMSVPEIWCHDGKKLTIHRLQNAAYGPIESSIDFPGLTADLINRTLEERGSIGETKLIKKFRSAISSTPD